MGSGKRTPGRVAAALLCVAALLAGLAPAALAAPGGKGRAEGRQGFQRAEDFEDMGEARWAARYVAAGQVMGLIQGYRENGRAKFKPNQPLKRQEAVALVVRALGWEAAAQDATVSGSVYGGGLPFRDAERIQPWARGAVALAVERGLVDAGEPMFQPLRPATRAWVVKLMVRALGLEAQARQRMGEVLSFRDAPAIPADAVGHVAVAVDVGLVAGFPEDNTFRPEKPVTRAQMAKFLEVLVNEIQQGTPPGAPSAPEGVVHGVVAAVAADGLTLRGATGAAERRVAVAAGADVFVDDAPATLEAVRPGFRVKLYLDASGRAVLVDARSAPAKTPPQQPREDRHPLKRSVSGIVTAVAPQIQCVRAPCVGGSITIDDGRGGDPQSFLVAEWAEVAVDGDGFATLADVSVGDAVKLELRNGVAVKVEVKGRGNRFKRVNRVK